MSHKKVIFSTFLASILLATQIIAVGAAPTNQDTTPITGIIESITLETGTTTVVVTLTNEMTIRLSLEDAIALDLVMDYGTGPVRNDSKIGTTVEINPAMVIPDAPDETTDEAQHPVGTALSDFFYDLLGVDYETVMEFHDDGIGFGVIAQALWMTNALEGDSETFAAILEAKQNKDYSAITLSDGSTPQNWGQFRKAVMSDQEKAKNNLGYIMSGHAGEDQGDEGQTEPKNNGNAPDKDKDEAKDKNKEQDNNKDKAKDKDKGKDKDKNKNK